MTYEEGFFITLANDSPQSEGIVHGLPPVLLPFNMILNGNAIEHLHQVTLGSMFSGDRNVHDDVLAREVLRYNVNPNCKTNFQVVPTEAIVPYQSFAVNFVLGYDYGVEEYFTPSIHGFLDDEYCWGTRPFPTGIFEIAKLDGRIAQMIRYSKGYILLDHSFEAWLNDDTIRWMHSYFQYHEIPLNKIIYRTATVNAKQYYEQRAMVLGLQGRVHVVEEFRLADGIAHNEYEQEKNRFYAGLPLSPAYDTKAVPQKKFLSFNYRHHPHRVLLMMFFQKLGMMENSYFSLPKEDDKSSVGDPVDFMRIKFHEIMDCPPTASDFTNEEMSWMYDQLPLTIDGDYDSNNVNNDTRVCDQDFATDTKSYYDTSLVSIITETYFAHQGPTSFTEKVYKPMRGKHPFIILGRPGIISQLHRLGFKTFNQWWNESYDTTTSPATRLRQIINVCEEINSWDDTMVLKFKEEVAETIEHNYNVLIRNAWSPAYNEIYNTILNDE